MSRATADRRVLETVLGAALSCALILASTPTSAVVIRHDRADADALRLGERFVAAGRVLPDGGCTLIAPTWALTAAHVAASIAAGDRVQFGDLTYPVQRTIVHPQGTGPRGVPPEVDLALIELGTPVTAVTPVSLYRKRDEQGQRLFIVGYGDYGTAGTALTRGDGRRRAVTNVVNDAGPRRIFMAFDEPPPGSEFEGVGGPGDSGGPALLEEDGVLFVAGVSSGSMNGKPGQYGVTDVYTRVSSYIAWIEQAMGGR